MIGKEIYQIWAPTGKNWVNWVRPVPFVGVKEHRKGYHFSESSLPIIGFLDENYSKAAIIVDLPGAESVKEGLALAKAGFRPIPIFNGTMEQQGARATTDNQSAATALIWGAEKLRQIEIADDAPPAFLLDRNRLQCFKIDASIYDNSWDIYAHDMPSPEYFLKNDIHQIIIIGESVAKDLKKILYKFQKKKIQILLTKGYEVPKKVRIFRPLVDLLENS